MTIRFPWGPPLSIEHPLIEDLGPDSVRDLRYPMQSRFDANLLKEHLLTFPSHALWVPATGEYVVAEGWRRRADIAHIVEVTARKGRRALLDALLHRLRSTGYGLSLITDDLVRDHNPQWAELGFRELERIVFYRKDLRGDPPADLELPSLFYSPLNASHIDLLLSLDHASFPPLWWNSAEEFRYYLGLAGVQLYGAWQGGEPVGYAAFTIYNRWAHLDRLAVGAQRQGRGIGAAQLVHALQKMREAGCEVVNLSTQEANAVSRRLYERHGFKRQRETMTFYGVQLLS